MAIKIAPKNIPNLPGVYFFRNAAGKPLYIGKAANLRTRLRSRILPKETQSISWEALDSEVEALIREAGLIKKYLPKYNVLMRDDKQYFFVSFSKETFPKIFITHQKNKNANYIGPFTEGGVLRSALKTLRRAFPYCTCKKPHKRLCLNARIGRCLGFCCVEGGKGETEKYKKNIRSIKQILSGKNKSLARALKEEMHKLSGARKYEEAGKLRDQVRALEKIFAHRGVIKQDLPAEFAKALRALESLLKINEIKRIEAYDIANIHGRFAYGSMAVFQDGQIRKDAYRLFKIKSTGTSNDPLMMHEIITRRFNHNEWPYPEVIIVDGGRAQRGAALAALNPSKSPLRKGRTLSVIAITKNKKHVGDHIFVSGKALPISIVRLPESLKNLILMLDSEAHRFAISHYRRLHRKRLLT